MSFTKIRYRAKLLDLTRRVEMSLLDKIIGKSSNAVPENTIPAEPNNQAVVDEVDHLWMKEDIDAKKPALKNDPRVDTGILRNRIAEKISKMNNH